MALEPGILTQVEDWAITTLAALKDGNEADLFKTVDHWHGQLASGGSGYESFNKYTAFAFVQAELNRVSRQGDGDGCVEIQLFVMIGQSSKEEGICRLGDATHVGTNRMFEKVLLALDGKHPGDGIACDDFFLTDVLENINQPKRHGIQPVFTAKWIPLNT